ncbi:MAG: lysophospholipid acyltransferase family protein [Bacteroidales bacterium]|jgi:predicted LPLAT superfamily acyltransferase|nr:lysophospholipid acyltransferase family protein [Bacteroidales bacterium]
MQQPRQWKGKTGGGTFGQKSLLFIFRIIHVAFFYPVLFVVIPFYMLFGRRGYLAIMRYFKQIRGLSTWKAFWQICRNHLVFGQVVLDRFALLAKKKEFFKINITGESYFDRLIKQEKGFIIASSHIGNFELAGLIFRQSKKKIFSLVYDGENPELQRNREKAMQESNVTMISVKEDMSHLFIIKQTLDDGNVLVIPCDRMFGNMRKIKINFLGHDAYFPLAPFRMAVQLDMLMVSLFVMKDNYKTYHVHILPMETHENKDNPVKRASQLANAFARNCEEILEKYPRQWFNFYNFWEM